MRPMRPFREERTPRGLRLRRWWPSGALPTGARRAVLTSAVPTVVQLARTRLHVTSRDHERGGWPRLHRGGSPAVPIPGPACCPANWPKPPGGTSGRGSGRLQGIPAFVQPDWAGPADGLARRAESSVRCTTCHGAMEHVEQRLHCRGCGAERPPVCAACGSTRLKVLRPRRLAWVREELRGPATYHRCRRSAPGPPARSRQVGNPRPEGSGRAHRAQGSPGGHRGGATSTTTGCDGPTWLPSSTSTRHLLAARFAAAEESSRLAGPWAGQVGRRSTGPPRSVDRPAWSVDRCWCRPGSPITRSCGLPRSVTLAPLARSEGDLRHQLSLPPDSALALVSGVNGREYVDATSPRASVARSDLRRRSVAGPSPGRRPPCATPWLR